MYIFTGVLGITLFLSLAELKNQIPREYKKFFMILLSALFVFLSAVRTVPAGDYGTYKEVHDLMCVADSLKDFTLERNHFYEFLYSSVMFISKWVLDAFPFFLFLLALIIAILQYKVITFWGDYLSGRGNKNSYELTSFFMLWCLYFGNIFVIRSTLALYVCLFSIRYMERRKFIPFLVCVTAATFFHYSAIIFVMSYVIYLYKGKAWKKTAILLIGSMAGMYCFGKCIQIALNLPLPSNVHGKLIGYAEGGVAFGTGLDSYIFIILLKAVLNIGVIFGMCIYLMKYEDKPYTKVLNGYVNLYFVGAIIYLSTMFQSFAFSRIAQYYNIFQFPVMLLFLKRIEISKNKFLYRMAFYMYLCLRFTMTMYTGYTNYIPFTTIFH